MKQEEKRNRDVGSRKLFVAVILLLSFLFLQSCNAVTVQETSSPQPPVVLKASRQSDRYLIQVGDLLEVKFFENRDLNEEVRVRPDGRISLQLVGEIAAAGATPSELRQLIAQQYSAVLNDFTVSVLVREFVPQKVFVVGEVHTATDVDLVGPLTVLQAVAYAGGFTDSAKEDRILIIRRNSDGTVQTFQVNINKVIDGSDLGQDMLLSPYDTIYVP